MKHRLFSIAVLLASAWHIPQHEFVLAQASNSLSENFEQGAKSSYAAAAVTLSSGVWIMNDALTGALDNDRKNGNQSARIRNTGRITMNFSVTSGAGVVTLHHAAYGSDAASAWELWYSADDGITWTQSGSAVTSKSTVLTPALFTLNIAGRVRLEIRKRSGGTNRINIDDISVEEYNPCDLVPPSVHLTMGNPGNAVSDTTFSSNYLMLRTQYALSYNREKATPNWVAWHLGTFWLGALTRQTSRFRSDTTLPLGWYRVTHDDYTNSGFDRGHMCPSADRTAIEQDNLSTFILTNIIPQAPDNNQGPWARLEEYCRTLAIQGNELYIISGGYGAGGTGSSGTARKIAGSKITVPGRTWKVIIVLPEGMNDLCRVTTDTRVIAVDMPNEQGIRGVNWGTYRLSVDALESVTGYDFLSTVPDTIENVIETKTDNGGTQ